MMSESVFVRCNHKNVTHCVDFFIKITKDTTHSASYQCTHIKRHEKSNKIHEYTISLKTTGTHKPLQNHLFIGLSTPFKKYDRSHFQNVALPLAFLII